MKKVALIVEVRGGCVVAGPDDVIVVDWDILKEDEAALRRVIIALLRYIDAKPLIEILEDLISLAQRDADDAIDEGDQM